MNFTSFSGLVLAVCIIWFGVIHPAPKPELFLDFHAILLVGGGTLAAALIAFPFRRFLELGSMFIFGFLLKRQSDNRAIVAQIVVASTHAKTDPRTLLYLPARHPFLQEGFQLIAEGIIPESQLREILKQRSEFFKRSYSADAKMLLALAKFPPAFGLLGASTGMISMMVNLGKSGQDTVGPAMAVALVATFWGIAIANLVFLPLSDYASKIANDDFATRRLIIEGLMLLKQGKSPMLVSETLNSYLPVRRRVKPVFNKGDVAVKDKDAA